MANQTAIAMEFTQPKVGALIRARRKQLHMTLEEICQAAGISKGYLSQVERDQATPSLGTLAQIARSLDVGMDYFISAPSVEDSLTRAEERPKFSVDGSSVLYERIAADLNRETKVAVFLYVVPSLHMQSFLMHAFRHLTRRLYLALAEEFCNDPQRADLIDVRTGVIRRLNDCLEVAD